MNETTVCFLYKTHFKYNYTCKKKRRGLKKIGQCPVQCSSVGWVLSFKPKGHSFDSWSEHMPGLWVPSLVRAHARAAGLVLDQGMCRRQMIDVSLSCQIFSPFPSPSLPLSLESMKEKKKI